MSSKHAVITACILLLGGGTFPLVGRSQEVAKDVQPELTPYELAVQYAEKRMQLAEVELRHAIDINRRSPGMVPRMRIERLRSGLEIAKQQHDEAIAASSGGPERVQLRHAEEKIRLARIELETAKKLRKENVILPLELERLQLMYELAKMRLVILNNPENFTTLLHYIELKVDRMADEILELDQRLSKLEPSRGMLPKNP